MESNFHDFSNNVFRFRFWTTSPAFLWPTSFFFHQISALWKTRERLSKHSITICKYLNASCMAPVAVQRLAADWPTFWMLWPVWGRWPTSRSAAPSPTVLQLSARLHKLNVQTIGLKKSKVKQHFCWNWSEQKVWNHKEHKCFKSQGRLGMLKLTNIQFLIFSIDFLNQIIIFIGCRCWWIIYDLMDLMFFKSPKWHFKPFFHIEFWFLSGTCPDGINHPPPPPLSLLQ